MGFTKCQCQTGQKLYFQIPKPQKRGYIFKILEVSFKRRNKEDAGNGLRSGLMMGLHVFAMT